MASPPYRFTMFDLDSCLEVPKVIQDNGGLLSAAELANHLGYKSDNNGSFNTKLANARLFGLIEGSASAMRPSERALAILHPDYPAAERQARLEAFEAVPLFKAVLDQYHGVPLPDDTGLRNALTTRWGITPDKAPAVLARLLESADQAGLFSATGDRTKMIRATSATGGDRQRSVAPEPTRSAPEPSPSSAAGVRANKLIDGVLDMLPNEQKWDEASLAHWLRFFEDALRMYYKLPSGGGVRRPVSGVTDN